jgi:hypothetical protein
MSNMPTAKVDVAASSLIQASSPSSWWRRLVGGTRRLRERSDWANFAGPDWAERILQTPVTDDFHAKQGRSTGRLVLEHAGQTLSVYLKRHYRLPWWQGLLATVWPQGDWSPALQECRHLQWAQAQGLPVPRVVAAGEYLQPLGRLQSFLAIEELKGMIALHQAIPQAARQLEPAAFRLWKAGLAREMARLTRFLHQRHYFHKDLYLCHFYISESDTRNVPDWQGRVHMIDFHRLGRHRLTAPWWRVKDLGQLLYSSAVTGVDARDRLRFWRYYLGSGRRQTGGQRAAWLAWWVRYRGDRYHRHNDKKAG